MIEPYVGGVDSSVSILWEATLHAISYVKLAPCKWEKCCGLGLQIILLGWAVLLFTVWGEWHYDFSLWGSFLDQAPFSGVLVMAFLPLRSTSAK